MPADRRFPYVSWLMVVIAVLLVAVGYALALEASNLHQCCDAIMYQVEARSFIDGDPGLLPVHNYGYAAFLALLATFGVEDRAGIALAQVTLLYLTMLYAAYVIGRTMRSSVSGAMVWLAAVALLPAAAWSGLTLSEGLAVPLLVLAMALGVALVFSLLRDGDGQSARGWGVGRWLVVVALALVSGLAWMTRPGLIWVPVVMGLGLVVLVIYVAWRGDRKALALPVAFAVAVAVAVLPQFQFNDPLKSDLAGLQSGLGRQVFRYATDLTETGPRGIAFSPLAPEEIAATWATGGRTAKSRPWQATAMVAHVVSGWDARPSPAYIYQDTGNRWIVVSLLSGFLIAGPVCGAVALWQRRRDWRQPQVVALAALILVFLASQAVVAMTQAEFRFNAAGWVVAAFCLAMLTALGWWTRQRVAAYVAISVAATGFVLLVGQLTLMYSEWWLKYVGLSG